MHTMKDSGRFLSTSPSAFISSSFFSTFRCRDAIETMQELTGVFAVFRDPVYLTCQNDDPAWVTSEATLSVYETII